MDKKIYEVKADKKSEQKSKKPDQKHDCKESGIENLKCSVCLIDVDDFEPVCFQCYDDITVKKNFDEFRAIMIILNRKIEHLLSIVDEKNKEIESLKKPKTPAPKKKPEKVKNKKSSSDEDSE